MSKHRMLIFISVIALFCVCSVATRESCETPNGMPGVCKLLNKCPVLMTRYQNNKLDPFLKNSLCKCKVSVINILKFQNLILS